MQNSPTCNRIEKLIHLKYFIHEGGIIMKNRIITITRQFGSGGRTIGKLTAQKLGIPCYDEEIIDKIAEKTGFAKQYIAKRSEDTAHGGWYISALAGHNYHGYSTHDYIWKAQREALLELAGIGPCVIVGSLADCMLKEDADCLRVFIHADMDKRAKRIVEQYGESSESPEKRLKDKDKRRSASYHIYTDSNWEDLKNYDITLNSGVLGIEKCVEIISSLY